MTKYKTSTPTLWTRKSFKDNTLEILCIATILKSLYPFVTSSHEQILNKTNIQTNQSMNSKVGKSLKALGDLWAIFSIDGSHCPATAHTQAAV